jgi:pimeloyl-ACP methyl ester carboxylesterase
MAGNGRIIIPICGTHGLGDEWTKPQSPLMREFTGRSWRVPDTPFRWLAMIGGFRPFGLDIPGNPHDDEGRAIWYSAAQSFVWYLSHIRESECDVIAHSHGGQVAILARAVFHAPIRRLITVSTPPRKDMAIYRGLAADSLDRWTHVHGDWSRDIWARLGRLGCGWRPWQAFDQLVMPESGVVNIHAKGCGHSDSLTATQFGVSRVFETLL